MNFQHKIKKQKLSTKIKPLKRNKGVKSKRQGKNLYALSGTILLQNGGMVYELTLYGRLIHLLYSIGFSTEYAFVKLMRNVYVLFGIIGDFIAEGLGRSLGRFFGLISYSLRDFFAPFSTAVRAVRTIKDIFKKEKHYGKLHINTRVKGYILTGLKKHLHLGTNPFCYIFPIAALAALIYTATTVFSYNFVLEVYNNDLRLGYIENAKVMDEAQQEVSARIQYQDTENEWSVAPTYNISVADALPGDIKTHDTVSLANNLILSSGEEISESTGLFVDGRFYGATQDRIQLEADINSLLSGYTRNTEGSTVDFVQEVEMVDGLFLQSSVVEHSEIQNLISSTTGETNEQYTVLAGESSADVSVKFSLTSGELSTLNPGIDLDSVEEGPSKPLKRFSR